MRKNPTAEKVRRIDQGASDATQVNAKVVVDEESQKLALGCVIKHGREAYRGFVPLVSADVFRTESDRIIWSAIQAVPAHLPINQKTVADSLGPKNQKRIGDGLGISYLEKLVDDHAVDPVLLPNIAKNLLDVGRNRKAIGLVNRMLQSTNAHGVNGNAGELTIFAKEFLSVVEEETATHHQALGNLPSVFADVAPISWVIDGEIMERGINVISGPSGSGKSTYATWIARECIKRQGRAVLLLDRENSQPVAAERAGRVGLEANPLLQWAGGWIRDGAGAPNHDAQEIIEWVRGRVGAGERPLVIVDSMTAFFVGDENNAQDMRAFFAPLKKLADIGATAIVLGHPGKSDNLFRGSSDYLPSIDQALYLTNSDACGHLDRITLRYHKSRAGLTGTIRRSYNGGRFDRDDRQYSASQTVAEQLESLMRLNPNLTSTEFETRAGKLGISRNRARDFINDGVLAGQIHREQGAKNAKRFTLVGGEK